MATKPKCNSSWPHAYDHDRGGSCPLDQAQYRRETRRQQTTIVQREAMRAAAHSGQDVNAAEDSADEG